MIRIYHDADEIQRPTSRHRDARLPNLAPRPDQEPLLWRSRYGEDELLTQPSTYRLLAGVLRKGDHLTFAGDASARPLAADWRTAIYLCALYLKRHK